MLRQIERADVIVHTAGLDAGHIEKILDHAREALGLAADRIEKLAPLIRRFVNYQCAAVAEDRRQRGAQLVPQGADHIGLEAI